jgi:hypothetical protein
MQEWIQSYISPVIGSMGKTWIDVWDTLDRFRLLTPEQSMVILVGVSVVLFVPIVHLWLRYRKVGLLQIALISPMPLLVFLMQLQVPQGFAGTPDDNCGKYDNGQLVFTVLDAAPVSETSTNPNGSMWLLVLVRAPPRWGDEPHQCRLSLSDPKVKEMLKRFAEMPRDEAGRWSRDNVTFTFGGRDEKSNVTIRRLPSTGKSGPPEVQRKQDI